MTIYKTARPGFLAHILITVFLGASAPSLALPLNASDHSRTADRPLAQPLYADYQIAQLTPSAILNDLRNQVGDIINSASTSASRNSFEIYSYAQILLSQIDALANSLDAKGNRLADKVMNDLDKKQRQVVFDLQRSVATLASERDLTARQVKDVVNLTASSLSILPGSKDYPRVNNITPFYLARPLLDQTQDDTVLISIDGFFLSGFKPSALTVGDSSCTKSTETDIRVAFTCPKAIFQSEKSIKSIDYIRGQLTVYGRQGLLDRLINKPPAPKTYNVGFAVLPRVLGVASIDSLNAPEIQHIPESVSIQSLDRTRRFYDINNFCANARTGTWTIVKSDPSPSVKIDTSFQPIMSEYTGNRTRGFNIQQLTESAIVIGYHMDNNRDRTDRIGCSTGAYNDSRAWLGVDIRYQEKITTTAPASDVEIRPRNTTQVVIGSPFTWGADERFALPSSSLSFTLTANLFDGRTVIITPENMGARDKYFEVVYDSVAKQVILRPLPLEQLP
jgi:hypothetical protein